MLSQVSKTVGLSTPKPFVQLRREIRREARSPRTGMGSGGVWLPHLAQLLFRFLCLLSVAPAARAPWQLEGPAAKGSTALPASGPRFPHPSTCTLSGSGRVSARGHQAGAPFSAFLDTEVAGMKSGSCQEEGCGSFGNAWGRGRPLARSAALSSWAPLPQTSCLTSPGRSDRPESRSPPGPGKEVAV